MGYVFDNTSRKQCVRIQPSTFKDILPFSCKKSSGALVGNNKLMQVLRSESIV